MGSYEIPVWLLHMLFDCIFSLSKSPYKPNIHRLPEQPAQRPVHRTAKQHLLNGGHHSVGASRTHSTAGSRTGAGQPQQTHPNRAIVPASQLSTLSPLSVATAPETVQLQAPGARQRRDMYTHGSRPSCISCIRWTRASTPQNPPRHVAKRVCEYCTR